MISMLVFICADSSSNDLVAVKSGWDEYGIAYGCPIGSKASGGVENVLADHINRYNMGVGINIKTNIGSGGFIRSITVSDMYIEKVRKGVKIALAGDVGDRRDEKCNQNALPIVKGITLKDIWCVQVQQADQPPRCDGIKKCLMVSGAAHLVSHLQCSELSGAQKRASRSNYS
ncbi:hypothetical protein D8674_039539 [Pyrus ussuriensis x Pyrus communis]|uniref:Polygalacturonase-like n=1 Tax=Pyrus ussuriensis x Pyrus communis TaxID=2448454 RepID=A0A5N5H3N0_9ROSA|nr:hypothetical protein D8674_039539 [Pyrus ussuriensis x Pyrus communis]